jgi:hypothetical protein
VSRWLAMVPLQVSLAWPGVFPDVLAGELADNVYPKYLVLMSWFTKTCRQNLMSRESVVGKMNQTCATGFGCKTKSGHHVQYTTAE